MFSKQSGDSGLYLFLVQIFWWESITFGRGKKYIYRRNSEQLLEKCTQNIYLFIY